MSQWSTKSFVKSYASECLYCTTWSMLDLEMSSYFLTSIALKFKRQGHDRMPSWSSYLRAALRWATSLYLHSWFASSRQWSQLIVITIMMLTSQQRASLLYLEKIEYITGCYLSHGILLFWSTESTPLLVFLPALKESNQVTCWRFGVCIRGFFLHWASPNRQLRYSQIIIFLVDWSLTLR
jgi:hypothetical protein